MEAVVDDSLAGGFLVPFLQGREEALAWLLDGPVDHGRDAAGGRRGGARAEVICGVGAHERHFEVCVDIDGAGQHVLAEGVHDPRRRPEVHAQRGHLAAGDAHIRPVDIVAGDDGAALDDQIELHGSPFGPAGSARPT